MVKLFHFILSSFIGIPKLFIQLVGAFIIIPIMMLCGWDGKTTWFGNREQPFGAGNGHMPEDPNFFQKWYFMAFRNPTSNLGKYVLAAPHSAKWPWLYDVKIIGKLYFKFGWQTEEDDTDGYRKFYYRPWIINY